MLNKRILQLALPSIAASVTLPLVGMVDLAIAGRLEDLSYIAGITLGSMIFDMLYWNFSFLRIGTGGLTAQAYGQRNLHAAANILAQAMIVALVAAVFVLAIQLPVMKITWELVSATDKAKYYAEVYFLIRIWAAPATISLFALKGWFIGMQNSVSPMLVDFTINFANVILSVALALWLKMGVAGIALGTVLSQYLGLLLSLFFVAHFYGKLGKYINIRKVFSSLDVKKYFFLNADILVRSLLLLLIYTSFTSFSSSFGDAVLASNTLLLKVTMLYVFIIDGFAYAGEALTGRYIGAREPILLRRTIKLVFLWSLSIVFVSVLFYIFAAKSLLSWLADGNALVIEAADPCIIWIIILPIVSSVAFLWDSIFIGATSSEAMRNVVFMATIVYFGVYYTTRNMLGVHALWFAFMLSMLVRSIGMQCFAKRAVFDKSPLPPHLRKS